MTQIHRNTVFTFHIQNETYYCHKEHFSLGVPPHKYFSKCSILVMLAVIILHLMKNSKEISESSEEPQPHIWQFFPEQLKAEEWIVKTAASQKARVPEVSDSMV